MVYFFCVISFLALKRTLKSSRNGKQAITLTAVVNYTPIVNFTVFTDKLTSFRIVKEQMGSGRSQETLDSVGLKTPSESGTSVHEGETVEGNCFDRVTHEKVVVGHF